MQEITDIMGCKNNIQLLCQLINSIFDIDVFFVNKDMTALAGTGHYKKNIGTKRPRESFVDLALHSGELHIIGEPRYAPQCYKCEYREICPYKMGMVCPLTLNNRVEGLFGFIAYDNNQKRRIIHLTSLLREISEKNKFFLKQICKKEEADINNINFLSNRNTKEYLNIFEKGIVITTPDDTILNINSQAEHILSVNGKKIMGSKGKDIFAHRSLIRSFYIEVPRHNNAKSHLNYKIVLIDKKPSRKYNETISRRIIPPLTVIGRSSAIIRLKEQAAKVAKGSSSVLIIGETGTGKEVIAKYIHDLSPRNSKPFIVTNCSAIPDSLFESELFGYEPGAFTGATKKGKPGKFQLADGGTLFLDEVGRLSISNQAKILRILEDGILEKLGSENKIKVDVRIIAATNQELEALIKTKFFLQDLYYRLSEIRLYIPPLRERTEDIPLFVDYFFDQLEDDNLGRSFMRFSSEAISYIQSYNWPGNIRELKNMVTYVLNFVEKYPVSVEDLFAYFKPRLHFNLQSTFQKDSANSLKTAERSLILQAIKHFGEKTSGKKQAAKYLGISLSSLYRKVTEIKNS